MRLPNVTGANLARQRKTFPADFSAELNLVFIAFQQWQQAHVDTWVQTAETLRKTLPSFDYYEFPTIQRMNFLARTFINEGMRAGIPDEYVRARTVTLYLEKEPFRRSLDISDERRIWTYLFDGEGQVLWRTSGPYTLEKGQALHTAIADSGMVTPAI